mgnify:CR=1 FL=1
MGTARVKLLVEQVDGKLVERYIERGHEAKRIEFEYADKTSALNSCC